MSIPKSEKLEALRQLDFLIESSIHKVFYIKGTKIKIMMDGSNNIFFKVPEEKDTGWWRSLKYCFDRLPEEVREKLIWHLDLFR